MLVTHVHPGRVGRPEVAEPLRILGQPAGGPDDQPAPVPCEVGAGVAERRAALAPGHGEDHHRRAAAGPAADPTAAPAVERDRDAVAEPEEAPLHTGHVGFSFSPVRRQRMPASMKSSMSPSKTPLVLPTSCSVRRSLTIWYGCST